MEKVIVAGADSDGYVFVKCFNYKNDDQLLEDVSDYIGSIPFSVIYEENLPELEEAIEEMYEKTEIKSNKLTVEDAKNIKLLLKSGDFTQREIAANYGVSRRTIGRIIKSES